MFYFLPPLLCPLSLGDVTGPAKKEKRGEEWGAALAHAQCAPTLGVHSRVHSLEEPTGGNASQLKILQKHNFQMTNLQTFKLYIYIKGIFLHTPPVALK